MVLMEAKKKNTHTKTGVTEQVSRTSWDKDTIESVEREENEEVEIQSHVHSCLLYVRASAGPISTDSWGVKLSPHTLSFREAHRSSSLIHGNTFSLSLPSHPSSISISVLFQTSPLRINLLIRNYANDPKKREKQCASVWVLTHVYCDELVLKNPARREKLFKGLSARFLSSLILLHFL